ASASSSRRTHVPQLHVLARGGQGLAVRAPRHGHHIARVPLEGGLLLAGGRLPQLDRFVRAARGGQGLAVRPPRPPPPPTPRPSGRRPAPWPSPPSPPSASRPPPRRPGSCRPGCTKRRSPRPRPPCGWRAPCL